SWSGRSYHRASKALSMASRSPDPKTRRAFPLVRGASGVRVMARSSLKVKLLQPLRCRGQGEFRAGELLHRTGDAADDLSGSRRHRPDRPRSYEVFTADARGASARRRGQPDAWSGTERRPRRRSEVVGTTRCASRTPDATPRAARTPVPGRDRGAGHEIG